MLCAETSSSGASGSANSYCAHTRSAGRPLRRVHCARMACRGRAKASTLRTTIQPQTSTRSVNLFTALDV